MLTSSQAPWQTSVAQAHEHVRDLQLVSVVAGRNTVLVGFRNSRTLERNQEVQALPT